MTRTPASLTADYAFTTMLALRYLDGTTQTQSVFQPGGGANCLNWVAGHMVQHRGIVLRMLDATPPWQARLERYATGSAPIALDGDGDGDGETIEALRSLLQESGDGIAAALDAAGEAGLARILEDRGQTQSVGDHIAGLHWHETFHLGQLDVLRAQALAGRA